jgi:hypothetical protein
MWAPVQDELQHDAADELAAYKPASLPFPGVFGVFRETDRPTKNSLEKNGLRKRGKRPAALPISKFSRKPSTE